MLRFTRKRGGSKSREVLPNPFPEGVKWGNWEYSQNQKLPSSERRRRMTIAPTKTRKMTIAPSKTRKNSTKTTISQKCETVLNELIPYKNKKGNATITVRDALKGCEAVGCKFWHEGQGKQKRGQLECRFSDLKRKAMGILKKKCPEYLRR